MENDRSDRRVIRSLSAKVARGRRAEAELTAVLASKALEAGNLEEALDLASEAKKSWPEVASSWKTLVMGYFKLRQYKNCRKAVHEMLVRRPGDNAQWKELVSLAEEYLSKLNHLEHVEKTLMPQILQEMSSP
ncbi:hypothetical protein KJ713_02940 [Patescibacteria group bacterium]|nr:hypothetical protein [Patescibacteria group bacterium]